LDEQTMSTEDQGGKPGPWILFPEIIGISMIALLLPLPLVHMLLSGQAFAGIVGFAVWLVAVSLAVRFIRRHQYGLAYLPMFGLLGLFFLIWKLCQ
jgi:polyferredoxin